jgi:hypothetical protein
MSVIALLYAPDFDIVDRVCADSGQINAYSIHEPFIHVNQPLNNSPGVLLEWFGP